MRILRLTEGLPSEDYLRQETELVKSVQEPVLFTWIVAPTVIYGRHQVRMAYVLNKEDLGKAMIVLRKALEAYNGK